MLVGQENSRASLGKTGGRREEGGLQLETRCCWAAENSIFRRNGKKDSTERQSWAAVHPDPWSSALSHLGSSVLPLTKDCGRWRWAPGTCHTTQNSMSSAVHSVPCLPTVCSSSFFR